VAAVATGAVASANSAVNAASAAAKWVVDGGGSLSGVGGSVNSKKITGGSVTGGSVNGHTPMALSQLELTTTPAYVPVHNVLLPGEDLLHQVRVRCVSVCLCMPCVCV
jgi:hypothetical protein